MRFPRSNDDTTRLGYISTKEGESSKSGEQRNNKGKSYKPTCSYRKCLQEQNYQS